MEEDFKLLLQIIVENYQLSAEVAAQMLRRILAVLQSAQKEGIIP